MAHFAWPLSKQTPVLSHKSNVAKKQKSCKTNCSHLLRKQLLRHALLIIFNQLSTSTSSANNLMPSQRDRAAAHLSRWLI